MLIPKLKMFMPYSCLSSLRLIDRFCFENLISLQSENLFGQQHGHQPLNLLIMTPFEEASCNQVMAMPHSPLKHQMLETPVTQLSISLSSAACIAQSSTSTPLSLNTSPTLTPSYCASNSNNTIATSFNSLYRVSILTWPLTIARASSRSSSLVRLVA